MNSLYITIFEDGTLNRHAGKLPQEVLGAADDGLYDVIDISDPTRPLRYWGGGWEDIAEFKMWVEE